MMDEKDGPFSNFFKAHLSLDEADNAQGLYMSGYDICPSTSTYDDDRQDTNQDDQGSYDTIDSVHKDIFSKLNLSRFTSKREQPKTPEHLSSQYVPTLLGKRNDQVYNMNHKYRGKCVIINNTYFDSPTLPERKGTQADRERLTTCFRQLDFDVHNWDEKDCLQIRILIDKLSREDFTDHDCFVMCVLTHGDANCLYAKDDKYYVEYLFDSFKSDLCKSLSGKPKIFIIQACRGDRLDNGSIINFDVEDSKSTDVRIPQWADFLMAYSTIPGYYSWRNTTNGSWFIQAFVDVLMSYYKEMDLVSMLTIANQKVAYDFESNTPNLSEFHQRKQIPMIASMLTRRVHFYTPKVTGLTKIFSNAKIDAKKPSTSGASSSRSTTQSNSKQLAKEELVRNQIILNEKILKSSQQRSKNGHNGKN